MDYEGMFNDVFAMRERAKRILREWERYHWFFLVGAQDRLKTLISDCTYEMRRLYNEGRTQKIVFD